MTTPWPGLEVDNKSRADRNRPQPATVSGLNQTPEDNIVKIYSAKVTVMEEMRCSKLSKEVLVASAELSFPFLVRDIGFSGKIWTVLTNSISSYRKLLIAIDWAA